MPLSPERLARATSRHPWRTIAVWGVLLLASIGAIGGLLDGALTSESDLTNNPESNRAYDVLHDRLPGAPEPDEYVVVGSPTFTVDDPAFRRKVQSLLAEGRRGGVEVDAQSWFASGNPGLLSRDRRSTLIPIYLGHDPEDNTERLVGLARESSNANFRITITGNTTADLDFDELIGQDLENGELKFGFPIAVLILVLVLGSVAAALVTLLTAGVAIAVALALTALIGQAWALSDFVINIVFGMALALGIDYSLFIVSRYREERSHGRSELDAIDVAGSTAGRAVLFSGTAFALSMLGMVLVPQTDLRSVGAGATIAGLVAVFVSLTLMPALLGLLGDRVNALRVPFVGARIARGAGSEGRFWGRAVRAVMRRAVISLVAGVALLLAAAAPALELRYGESGVSTLPDRFPSRQGYEVLQREFARGSGDPVLIVVDGDQRSPEVRRGIARLSGTVVSDPLLGDPELRVVPARRIAVLSVPVSGDSHGEPAVDAVKRLRGETIPAAFGGSGARVLVTGESAESADYFALTEDWLPIVFAFVLGMSFLLLMVAFRSIVVPAKAILLNLISVGAAYGLLVLVFQEGIGNELFGFQQVDAIEAWLPLFLFSVLFGLSMDYHVLLLSRIRERYSLTGDNTESVAVAVGSTARLITGAALIIIAVYVGFASGELLIFQQLGFGVATALLIDATLIRLVLLPASMRLLGRWNWYLPSWLEWIPNAQVERPPESQRP